MQLSPENIPQHNSKLLLDRDNIFARMLDFYMDIEFISDRELAEMLKEPISKVIDMRLGVIWGVVTPDIVKKLDTIFNIEKGFFKKMLQKTLIVEDEKKK